MSPLSFLFLTTNTFMLILKSLSVLSGEPLSCTNITYNARDVALQWEEPILAQQNGQITGYNLTCSSVNPWADLSANLSASQSSAATIFTIDPVSPFTEYTCSLSAINEVGQGPPTQCTFSTQQAGQRQYVHVLHFYNCGCYPLSSIHLFEFVYV